jgi:hypothetical protein
MKLAGQNIRFPIDYEISLPPAEFFRMCSIKFSSGLIADYMVFDDGSLHIYGCWVDGTKPSLPGAVCDQLEHKVNP